MRVQANGQLSIAFRRALASSDPYDADLTGAFSLLWGVSPVAGVVVGTRSLHLNGGVDRRSGTIVFGQHTTYGAASANLVTGSSAVALSSADGLTPGQILLLIIGSCVGVVALVRFCRGMVQLGRAIVARFESKSHSSRLKSQASQLIELTLQRPNNGSSSVAPIPVLSRQLSQGSKAALLPTTEKADEGAAGSSLPASTTGEPPSAEAATASVPAPVKPRVRVKKGTVRAKLTLSRVLGRSIADSTPTGSSIELISATDKSGDLEQDDGLKPGKESDDANLPPVSMWHLVQTTMSRRFPRTDKSVGAVLLGVLLIVANVVAFMTGTAPTLARKFGTH